MTSNSLLIEKRYFWVIAGAVINGSLGVFVRFLDLAAFEIVFWRGLISTFVLLPIVIYNRKSLLGSVTTRKQWLGIFILSLSFVLFSWAAFISIKETHIANASVLFYAGPIWATGIAIWLLKKRLERKSLWLFGIAIIGVVLLSNPFSAQFRGADIKGLAWGFVSGVLYAVYILIAGNLKKDINRQLILFSQFCLGIVICLPFILKSGISVSGRDMIFLAIISCFHGVLTFYLYLVALKHVDPQIFGALSYLAPAVAALCGYFILNEHLSPWGILGILCIIIAGTILFRFDSRKIEKLYMKS